MLGILEIILVLATLNLTLVLIGGTLGYLFDNDKRGGRIAIIALIGILACTTTLIIWY